MPSHLQPRFPLGNKPYCDTPQHKYTPLPLLTSHIAHSLGTPMSKSSKPKALGLGGLSAPNIAKSAKTITSTVSKGKAGFKGATVKSTQRMKPETPIIGGKRDPNVNFATINKERMKGTIKKTGL